MKSEAEVSDSGVSVQNTRTSKAFMLISFMVGELLYNYEAIPAPINLEVYKGLDELKFAALKDKILQGHEDDEYTHLSMEESIHLYMVVDLTCKCMVTEANVVLRDMASKSLDIGEEEYDQLRNNYLRYAEALLGKMNERFKEDDLFVSALEKLTAWNGAK